MDIKELEIFFNYKPSIDIDPQIIVDEIILKAKTYLPENQIVLVQKAFDFANKAHEWQTRLSWEPYIMHPLKATEFLMEIKPDIETIQTCLLHDTIEDCNMTKLQIEKIFWSEVANLCEWMVKVSKIKYKWEDRHIETLKKTFLAMAQDLRVIFVKLTDRIHNIQTLQYHPNPAKREKIAQETMKIFVPIAKRLWLYYYQLYLENWSFKILHPQDFEDIFTYMKKYFGEWEKYTDKWIKIITNLLNDEWVKDFIVKWRLKSPYRIFEKLEKRYHWQDLGNIMDLLAYRIITKTISDCYMVLWIIHKHYTPIIKKIKDYIAVPKINWYQSVHTTILWMFNFPTEIQIRTQDMDDIAEFWVAAHFAYSEDWDATKVPEQQTQWIKKLQTIVNTYKVSDEKEAFKKELNIEILDKRIYLYTPQWDVIELPQWSRVLDFAFSIHTDIGLSFKNAIINWEIKPINYRLKMGDVIKINTFKNKHSANKHRLEFIHTSWARANLNKFLKNQEKEETLRLSIINLNKNLKNLWLPLFHLGSDKFSKIYKNEEIENRLINIANRKETYWELIKSIYPDEWNRIKNQQKNNQKKIKEISQQSVIVDGNKLINFELCPECNPQNHEKIIAKTGKDVIKIHGIWCKALKHVSLDKLLEAHREWDEENKYKTLIELKINYKHWIMLNMLTIFTDAHINVLQVSMKNLMDWTSVITFESEFSNPAKISFLLNNLKKYDNSVQVLKKKIS